MGVCSNKVSYYNYMKKVLKNNYDENYSSLFNKNFGFQKNKFIQRKLSKNNNAPINYYLNWKNYLLEKLKSYNSKSWNYALYNSLINDEFNTINEFLYQNEIFFEEFSVLNMPKSLEKIDKKNTELNKDNVLYPFDSDEIKNASNDISFDMTNEDRKSDCGIINNIENSNDKEQISYHLTLDVKNESIESNLVENPKYEVKYNINQIKKYCRIILKQLKDKFHPINIIIKKFTDIFVPYLNNKMNKHKDELDKVKNRIIKDLQYFIEIMQVTLKLFYINSINYKFFVSERDEFINIISYILFNQKREKSYIFYDSIFKLFQYSNRKKSNELEQKIKKFGKLTPREAGVCQKFCLDKESELFFEEYKNNKNKKEIKEKSRITNYFEKKIIIINKNDDDDDIIENEINIDKQIFNERKLTKPNDKKSNNTTNINNNEESSSYSFQEFAIKFNSYNENQEKLKEKLEESLNFIFNTVSTQPSEKDKNFEKNKFNLIPYFNAIEYIKTIVNYKVPIEKLTIIALTSIAITKCVDEYWKKEKDLPPKFLNIDADEIMSIYLYIIYNMNLPSIFTELDFIQHFTTDISKKSMVGYYYTTLRGCLDFIMKAETKESFVKI
jgi:hypothetical protein